MAGIRDIATEIRSLSWPDVRDRSHAVIYFTGLLLRRFDEMRCFSMAGALTYTSLLALVPLMAVSLSLLSAFPVFTDTVDRLKAMALETLVPQLSSTLEGYLNSFTANVGQMTAPGIVGLVVTSVLVLNTIMSAFANIWNAHRPRPWSWRILVFWAVLTLGPLLFGTAMSISTSVALLAEGINYFARLLPLLLEALGFTLFYAFIPNRPVRWRHAIWGGVVAAILFEILKRGFAIYVDNFVRYEVIYGALATLPIFLMWMYLSWSVVLFGAVMTATLPEWRAMRAYGGVLEVKISPTARLWLAVAFLGVLREAARSDGHAVSRAELFSASGADAASLSGDPALEVLDALSAANYIAGSDQGWVLSRDLEQVTLAELARALEVGLHADQVPAAGAQWSQRLHEILQEFEKAASAVRDRPLAEVVADLGATGRS